MNRMPLNIEKSAFRRGEYVGYGRGPWRVLRGGAGWNAFHRGDLGHVTARTLAELGKKIEERAR